MMISWVLADRKSQTQLRMFPQCFSLSISRWLGARSKALEISRSTASICCLSFSENELGLT